MMRGNVGLMKWVNNLRGTNSRIRKPPMIKRPTRTKSRFGTRRTAIVKKTKKKTLGTKKKKKKTLGTKKKKKKVLKKKKKKKIVKKKIKPIGNII